MLASATASTSFFTWTLRIKSGRTGSFGSSATHVGMTCVPMHGSKGLFARSDCRHSPQRRESNGRAPSASACEQRHGTELFIAQGSMLAGIDSRKLADVLCQNCVTYR